jgi:hypothetical protein
LPCGPKVIEAKNQKQVQKEYFNHSFILPRIKEQEIKEYEIFKKIVILTPFNS